ncbi:MAG: NAD(P)/FAD-dependent oxidoreductase [Rhodospirillales bacterium]
MWRRRIFLSQNPHFCHSALARYGARDFVALGGSARHSRSKERDHGQLFCLDRAQGHYRSAAGGMRRGQGAVGKPPARWRAWCAT